MSVDKDYKENNEDFVDIEDSPSLTNDSTETMSPDEFPEDTETPNEAFEFDDAMEESIEEDVEWSSDTADEQRARNDMDIQTFVTQNEVEYSDSLIEASDIPKIENAIGVSLGDELKMYILTYGYLAYKFSELYGVTGRQLLDSDLVKQTQYLHSYYPETSGLIAIENQGEGDYYLADSEDNVFELDTELKSLIPTSKKVFEYIIQRFESIK